MKNIYIIILFAFLNSSCNSFLDVKSDKSLVVVHTLDDALALLDDVFRMNEGRVPGWGVGVSDNFYLTEISYNLFPDYNQQFYKWNYQEYYGTGNDWGNGYQPIYNANLALEILNKIERSNSNAHLYDFVKGSALFYRSFYFYNLLVVFGSAYDEQTSNKDLGIVLRLTADFNDKSFRSTVKECFDQIESDLKESVALLPDLPTFVTRASKAAAYATLARLYLYKRDYGQALYYSDKALFIKSDLMDYNGDEDILTTINETASPFVKYNKETIFYAHINSNPVYFLSGQFGGVVDSLLYMSYDINDQRRKLFFRINQGLPYFKGNYTNTTSLFGGISTNELYLIKAECLSVLGRNNDAIKTLNILLENRIKEYHFLNLDHLSDNEILNYIRTERRKELIFRGLRFSDLKRYNKEGLNITLKRIVGNEEYLLEPNSNQYNLPLPSDLVKLTGLKQN